MNRPFLLFLSFFFFFGPTLFAQVSTPGTEINTPVPWQNPLPLAFPGEGNYRLEALTADGSPVEVVADRREADGTWVSRGTNRTLGGSVAGSFDLKVGAGESWRVRPAYLYDRSVTLKLTKTSFSDLKEALKEGLTSGPTSARPLKLRLTLPDNTGGPGLAVTTLSGGTLLGAWLTAGGAEAWNLEKGVRLGTPFQYQGDPWTGLGWDPSGLPVLVFSGPSGAEAKGWTGAAWSVEPVPEDRGTATGLGHFRIETAQGTQVFRAGNAGWEDLELPREPWADRTLLGSTDDGLYVLTGSSVSGRRGFYVWRPSLGWVALTVPQADGPPQAGLWALTAGAGSLFLLEGRNGLLTLRQFDGTEWRPPLDITALAPGGAVAADLIPPSRWSKTGGVVLVADGRIQVYDLP